MKTELEKLAEIEFPYCGTHSLLKQEGFISGYMKAVSLIGSDGRKKTKKQYWIGWAIGFVSALIGSQIAIHLL